MSFLDGVIVVIPAYEPTPALEDTVRALAPGVRAVIVVDDGSSAACRGRFDAVAACPGVHVVRHAMNLGKGAALKTGLNQALVTFADAAVIVTADADGQHHPDDVRRVAMAALERPGHMVLGSRAFDSDVPLRSRIGNAGTRVLYRLLVGQMLGDTQTGLRAIPPDFARQLLRIGSNGYEFELDMLMWCKQQRVPVHEVPVRTIYLAGNASSHFNPLFDSMRIYFVLLRFTALSVLTALVDNIVFVVVFVSGGGGIAGSQVAARAVALVVNYVGARTAVFYSRASHALVLPRYVALVLVGGLVSFGLIRVMVDRIGLPVLYAKVLAESVLFIANFAIQRDFVFTASSRERRSARTDWDRYYDTVPATARLTRRYTASVLLGVLRGAQPACNGGGPVLVELGGANSCFLDRVLADIRPAAYHVVDNNRRGLALLQARAGDHASVVIHEGDVLRHHVPVVADAVFSVGLIEHFDQADTARAVQAHFDCLRAGGTAIISFPTPTWLYRSARRACELLGVWNFPDERPLLPDEVKRAIGTRGEVVFEKTLWPLVLTQHLLVARKAR